MLRALRFHCYCCWWYVWGGLGRVACSLFWSPLLCHRQRDYEGWPCLWWRRRWRGRRRACFCLVGRCGGRFHLGLGRHRRRRRRRHHHCLRRSCRRSCHRYLRPRLRLLRLLPAPSGNHCRCRRHCRSRRWCMPRPSRWITRQNCCWQRAMRVQHRYGSGRVTLC